MEQPKIPNERREKLRRILQPLWDTYQHMYESRRNYTFTRINFLLIVTSFLPIISITLFTHYKNEIFLLPALFQIGALLLLIKSFFIKGDRIPWVDPDKILALLEKDKFEGDFFAQLKAAEGDTHIYRSLMEKSIEKALYLLVFSVYATILIFPFLYIGNSDLLYITVLGITIGLLTLFNYYAKPVEFKFDESYARELKRIEDWLKGKPKENKR